MSELAINDSKNKKNAVVNDVGLDSLFGAPSFWRMRPKLWGPGSRNPTRLRSKEAWGLGYLSSIVPSNFLVATSDPGFPQGRKRRQPYCFCIS